MSTPRVLRIDLERLERGQPPEPGPPLAPPFDRIAPWGGTALGLACLAAEARARRAGPEPLVLAVGSAVCAALPTAARAAVLARAPLSGRTAEGHVGGELGGRLAHVADALVLTRSGAPRGAGRVLVLEADGGARVCVRPDLAGAAPEATSRALAEAFGPAAVLAIGPGGEQGLPFASLASGHAPPSFVGRGGLGAVLGGLGLKALVIRAPLVPIEPRARHGTLAARLESSPRLAARAAGGTLELFEAHDARGRLAGGAALAREARDRAGARHGCRGCPTPCGWVFERSDGVAQGARFGASRALGPALGLASLDEALQLLATCDALGIDAKEVGAILALRARAEPSARPRTVDAWRSWIEQLVRDPHAPGRAGAARLARELGLADPAEEAARAAPEARSARLARAVASGGADPMRSFPFLLESADPERLARLLDPLPLTAAVLDERVGAGKGRLVWWHENLIAAVDLTGFCAFSAAGLLADGLCDLDELARWIAPPALRDAAAPGARLLAAGASLVLARHALNRLHGVEGIPAPPEARGPLEEPGMLDEYARLRGLDAAGCLTDGALAALGGPEVLQLGNPAGLSVPARASAEPRARAPGLVTLRAGGALAAELGTRRTLHLELPCSCREVVQAAVDAGAEGDEARRARLESQLLRAGAPLPAVWCAGRRLLPEDLVEAGDELELVTVLAGG